MADILRDTIVVVRTCLRAILLAKITMRKSNSLLFNMAMELRFTVD